MRKVLVILCMIAITSIAFAVPSAAQSDRVSDGERPPADGGYHPCPSGELLSEMGIRFAHTAYAGSPTVFQIIPTDSGGIHIHHLERLITRRPTLNLTQLGAYAVGGIIGGTAVRVFDATSAEYQSYKREFIKCLSKHPMWIRYWSSRIVLPTSGTRSIYIKSWESIYLQLACHAIGAVAGEIVEDTYRFINFVTGGLVDSIAGLFRDRNDEIDINVGNPTWDLEGHRPVEYNIAVWTKWTCNWP